MEPNPQSLQFRLLVAERRFLVALALQLLLMSMLLHVMANAQAVIGAAARTRSALGVPFDPLIYEVLCWVSFFVGLYAALRFLRWVERLRAAAEAAAGERALPRSLFGWIVPLASLLRPQPGAEPGRQRSAPGLRPATRARLDAWWITWFVLHLCWVAVFLATGERVQRAAVTGDPVALAEAVLACRLSIGVQVVILITAGGGFVLTNLQMRRLFRFPRAEAPMAPVSGSAGDPPPSGDREPPAGRRPASRRVPSRTATAAEPLPPAPVLASAVPAASDAGHREEVVAELEAGMVDGNLWAAAFAQEHGDEVATLARYVGLRAARLAAGEATAGSVPQSGPPHRVDVEA